MKLLLLALVPLVLLILIYAIVWVSQYASQWAKFASDNKLVVGSLYVGIIGSIATTIYFLILEAVHFVKDRFILSLALHNNQELYDQVMKFLGKQHILSITDPSKAVVRFLSAPALRSKLIHVQAGVWRKKNIANTHEYEYQPESGMHVFYYRNRIMWCVTEADDNSMPTGYDESQSYRYESCTMNLLGNAKDENNRKILQQLMDDASKEHYNQHAGLTKVYVAHPWINWALAAAKAKRPFNSVILDGDISQYLLNDIKTFLSSSAWYKEKSVPFRRGYLLYGPPGTGKSSFVSAVASEMNMGVCVMNLASGDLNDDGLSRRFHSAPSNSIILLEDVDAVFLDRNAPSKDENKRKTITFSGLLNAIDGVAAQEDGKLLFMTTNHIEKLDPALIRAGRYVNFAYLYCRCDVKILFDYASMSQMEQAVARFFPAKTDEELRTKFMKVIHSHRLTLTMAQLSSFLSKFRQSLQEAIDNIQELLDEVQADYSLSSAESKSVPLAPWLKRLGLFKYSHIFEKNQFYVLSDIFKLQQRTFSKNLQMDGNFEVDRVMDMIKNKPEVVSHFAYATKAQVEQYFLHTFPNATSAQTEQFVKSLPPLQISLFELRLFLHEANLVGIEFALNPKNVDALLINPSPYHVKSHKYMTETLNKENVQQFRTMSYPFETTKEWLLRLNGKFGWWNEQNLQTPATVETKNPDAESKDDAKDDGNKDDDDDDEEHKDDSKKDTSSKTKKNDDKKIEDEPDLFANVLTRLLNQGFTTTQHLVHISASQWKSEYRISQKGRRFKLEEDLKKLKKKFEKFETMQLQVV